MTTKTLEQAPAQEPASASSQATPRREGGICPNCGLPGVHRSHRKGVIERLLTLAGGNVRRCHACDARFARFFNSTIYIKDARHALRRASMVLLMLAGAALVLLVMLWLMNRQAAVGPSDVRLIPPRSLPA